MVVLSSTLRGRILKFHTPPLPPNTLMVLAVRGRESISSPFRFELDLVSKSADVDTTAVLQAPAFIGIKEGVPLGGSKRGIRTLKIHGCVASIEQCGKALSWVSYRAVLVPRLWRLSLNVQSRIFLDKTVPEIVEEVLKGMGLAAEDYEFRTTATYPKREYVVQYQESDLNFIQRLLEHAGIFYYFEHDDDRERIVFGDAPGACKPVPAPSTFRFNPSEQTGGPSGGWFEESRVSALTFRHALVPSEVVLRDYNYRTPSVDLTASAPVVEDGAGRFYEYGDHYKDQGEGKALAQVRAEEIKCRQKLFLGQSDIRCLRSGSTYTLIDHFQPDFNRDYLVTEVKHEAKQTIELSGTAALALASYKNEFVSIPSDVVFRPARTTPKPRIYGMLHAKVDASGDGQYAEIDDQGRYKAILPLDLSGRDKATATRWIRMAQPYCGPNGIGFHFPLHKGTEVILTHIDGDPDRPIIASAVPNPETPSSVTNANQTQCKIVTGGQNMLQIEDTEGSQQIKLGSPTKGSFMTMGAGNSPEGFNLGTAAHMNQELGGNDLLKAGGDQLASIAGQLMHTIGGPHATNVGGSKRVVVAGSNARTVGASDKAVIGASASMKVGASRSVNAGASINHKAGASHNIKAGASVSSKSGAATNIKAGASINAKAGAACNVKSGAATNIKAGAAINAKSGAATNIKAGAACNVKSGGPTNIKAGGPCNIKGSVNNITGPTNVKGKTSINGKTGITGNTFIKGNTGITGKTAFKGDHKVTGNCKFNGSTLEVS